MAHLNRKGPEEKGAKTGRGLGLCGNKNESQYTLGVGMGQQRHANCSGHGKRHNAGKNIN